MGRRKVIVADSFNAGVPEAEAGLPSEWALITRNWTGVEKGY